MSFIEWYCFDSYHNLPIFMSTKDSASIFWLFCTYILYIYNSQQKINYPRANYLPTIIYVRWGEHAEPCTRRTRQRAWHPRDAREPLSAAAQSLRPEPSLVYTLFIFWSNFPQAHERSESGCFRSLIPSRLFLPVRVCCANRAFFGNLVYIPHRLILNYLIINTCENLII